MAIMSRHGMYAGRGSERSLSPGKATVRFQLAMPEDLLDEARETASKEGTTVSELIRDGLRQRLKPIKRR